ncbi:MAG: tRNA glutamyl-Q(34) synthetase GluQRS [Solirubrobacterales bacterium]|nr:tRNA glutamyl-Q(34) synthetase GluQRS [Solirubrobacterales bacterium]
MHRDEDPGAGAGRYAPSPTGRLHLGNLRTALLAHRAARERGAPFLLRIEDVDSGRSREKWVEIQLDELRRIGVDWDGDPVRQSDRHELYEAALGRLRSDGLVYECFCTRAEIREAASAPHGESPEGAYPGTCRELTDAERAERRAAGRPAALRVRAAGARVLFEDHVCGPTEKVLDDFVVRRNDGDFAYNLAVAVDDAEQEVAEVVRGADLLDTTPRQLWLYDRLELDPPRRFSHVPLMLGEDGRRLAKRHGAITLEERVEAGQSAAEVRAELLRSE